MRELDRNPTPTRCAIVGAGRLGTALAAALRATGLEIDGPLTRAQAPDRGVDAVLLCVPDAEIAAAAASAPAGVLVGHCSGANGLGVLDGREAFSLHPLTTVTTGGPARFQGVGAAVAGSTTRALAFALDLAGRLGMRATVVDDADRAAYHAAASIASNFLVTLEAAASTSGTSMARSTPAVAPIRSAAASRVTRKFEAIDAAAW